MPIRSLLGYALFSVGGCLTAFAGGRYAVGEWQRQNARSAWHEAEARAVVAVSRDAAVRASHTPAAIERGAPIARLLIPRIGLDEIVIEGVDDNALNAGPGHLPGSVLPGERGNSVVSAHRDRHFARFDEIGVGDTVVTESATDRASWMIVSKRVIDADAPALFRTREATLTLITCWPIRHLGTAPKRLILTAKPIRTAQAPSFANASTE